MEDALGELGPEGRIFVALPLFHHARLLCGVASNLYRGCTPLLMKSFETPKMMEMIRNEKAHGVITIPTVLQRFVQVSGFGGYLSNVRWFYLGGAPLPPPLVQICAQHGIRVGQVYGSVEIGFATVITPESSRNLNRAVFLCLIAKCA